VRQLSCTSDGVSGASNSTNVPGWTPATTGDSDLDLVVQELRPLINDYRVSQGLPEWTAMDLAQNAATLGSCALTFRFTVAAGTSLSFPYTLASSEYPLAKSANDVIGFFLTDTTQVSRNVGRVPTSNEPVGVISVNNARATEYYDAIGADGVFGIKSVYGPTKGAQTNGLVARARVERGRVYSIKLAIASAANLLLDTSVYVGPLRTDLTMTMTTLLNGNLIEGCSNATITFSLDLPSDQDTPVFLTVVTTATWSMADYMLDPVPEGMVGPAFRYTIPAGSTSKVVVLVPLMDNLTEGSEVLRVCMGTQCQSATVFDALQITEAFASPAIACPDVPGAETVSLFAVCPVCAAVGAQLFWRGPNITETSVGGSITARPPVGNSAYAMQARVPTVNPTCISEALVNVTGLAGSSCSQGTTRTTTTPPTSTTPTATTTTTSPLSTTSSSSPSTTTGVPTTSPPPSSCTNLPPQRPCLVELSGLAPSVCTERSMTFSIQTFLDVGRPSYCGPLDCGDRSWEATISWFNTYGSPVGSVVLYPSSCVGGSYVFTFTPVYEGFHSVELSYAGQPVKSNCVCPQLAPDMGFVADSCKFNIELFEKVFANAKLLG
jgi:hypothetical protein